MEYVSKYLFVSVVIAVVLTVYKIVRHNPFGTTELTSKEEFLDDEVTAGHLEKGVYGKRIVYNEKDFVGQQAVKAVDIIGKLKKERMWLYVIYVVCIEVTSETILWPKTILGLCMRKHEKN
jgi:hypothetical protein